MRGIRWPGSHFWVWKPQPAVGTAEPPLEIVFTERLVVGMGDHRARHPSTWRAGTHPGRVQWVCRLLLARDRSAYGREGALPVCDTLVATLGVSGARRGEGISVSWFSWVAGLWGLWKSLLPVPAPPGEGAPCRPAPCPQRSLQGCLEDARKSWRKLGQPSPGGWFC